MTPSGVRGVLNDAISIYFAGCDGIGLDRSVISKCNAVRHSFPPALSRSSTPNTGLSKSSASNPIGAEKRHTAKTGAAPRARGAEGAEKARASEAVPLRAADLEVP
jgi:hypothetical protein